jgi:hypothetical protein
MDLTGLLVLVVLTAVLFFACVINTGAGAPAADGHGHDVHDADGHDTHAPDGHAAHH